MNTDKWENLDVAMTASSKKTIKELFADDPGRAMKFSVKAAGWFLDYSKNRIDAKVMQALVMLAEASNLKAEIEKMFTGEKINRTENRGGAAHGAPQLRPDAKVMVDRQGRNARGPRRLKAHGRLRRRRTKGAWRGYQASASNTSLNIGIGGSDLGPVMPISR